MPLGNLQSIVKQIIFLGSLLPNLLLMISRRHWFLFTAFAIAVFSAVINSSFYLTSVGLILLPIRNQLARYFDDHVRGGIKGAIILCCLIIFCLLMPQVETNTAILSSPLKHLQCDRLS